MLHLTICDALVCRAKRKAIILSVFERWLPNAGHNNLTELTSGASRSNGVTPLQTAVTTSAEKITETRALALEAKLKLQAHFPDWNIKAEESLGSPAREILKRAAGWAPDLIAVGSQGCSGLGRFLEPGYIKGYLPGVRDMAFSLSDE